MSAILHLVYDDGGPDDPGYSEYICPECDYEAFRIATSGEVFCDRCGCETTLTCKENDYEEYSE